MSKIIFIGRQRQITDYSGSGNHIECLPFYQFIKDYKPNNGKITLFDPISGISLLQIAVFTTVFVLKNRDFQLVSLILLLR